jgi:hypothetical protein
MYTLKEIIKHWKKCYGEDMKKEYPGFIKQLIRSRKLQAASDKLQATNCDNLAIDFSKD